MAYPFITMSSEDQVFNFDEMQYVLSLLFLAFIVYAFFVPCLRNLCQTQGYYSCFLSEVLYS